MTKKTNTRPSSRNTKSTISPDLPIITSPPRYNGKHPGGRPTKYQENFPELIVKYFEEQVALEKLPFLSRFARHIAGVAEQTAIAWCDEYPEFSEAYKKAKQIQKEYLIENGLAGKYNATAFIFTAKNMTDMRDKTEVAHDLLGIEAILAELRK